jgi:hypothetical protein
MKQQIVIALLLAISFLASDGLVGYKNDIFGSNWQNTIWIVAHAILVTFLVITLFSNT